jgi:hypothetical protein
MFIKKNKKNDIFLFNKMLLYLILFISIMLLIAYYIFIIKFIKYKKLVINSIYIKINYLSYNNIYKLYKGSNC